MAIVYTYQGAAHYRIHQSTLVSHCHQVKVIKKAYQQESECEGGEVSPQEVGHNIYILALQVTLPFRLMEWIYTLL